MGNNPTRSSLTPLSPKALARSPNGVGNISGSCPLEGVDKQFLETYDNITKSNSTEDSSQYYCDKVCSVVGFKVRASSECDFELWFENAQKWWLYFWMGIFYAIMRTGLVLLLTFVQGCVIDKLTK